MLAALVGGATVVGLAMSDEKNKYNESWDTVIMPIDHVTKKRVDYHEIYDENIQSKFKPLYPFKDETWRQKYSLNDWQSAGYKWHTGLYKKNLYGVGIIGDRTPHTLVI